jgi:hypothetical protein
VIELRWMKRKVRMNKPELDDAARLLNAAMPGQFAPPEIIVPVLQYRVRALIAEAFPSGHELRYDEWSDWKNVPIVEEGA